MYSLYILLTYVRTYVFINIAKTLLLQNGETPLYIASLKGDTKAVKILARLGANVNIKNNVSFTQLTTYVCNTYVLNLSIFV